MLKNYSRLLNRHGLHEMQQLGRKRGRRAPAQLGHESTGAITDLDFIDASLGKSNQNKADVLADLPNKAREKKSMHHHLGTSPFSVRRPTPRSQSKKSYGVYHLLGENKGKGIHHRSGRRVCTIEASDAEKENGRFPRWRCILFSSCKGYFFF